MDTKGYFDNIYIVPILIFSVVIHEMAHGWVALKCGDTTARDLGRLTLNPVPHIDLFGSIIVPLFSILATGRVFIAWAKPVPVNPANFSSFKRDDTLVTIAGPISNLLIALLCSLMVIVLYYLDSNLIYQDPYQGNQFLYYIYMMFSTGITLNVALAVFNMLPIPPLDGSHVLANLLPDELAYRFRQIGFFGIFIILILFNYIPGFAQFFISIISIVSEPYINLIKSFIK
ncbi:MAG: site-2 protease family protein [Ignavibacteria bacterium]